MAVAALLLVTSEQMQLAVPVSRRAEMLLDETTSALLYSYEQHKRHFIPAFGWCLSSIITAAETAAALPTSRLRPHLMLECAESVNISAFFISVCELDAVETLVDYN